MGASICKSIDEKMNDAIFYPTLAELDEIQYLFRNNDKHVFIPSTNETKISVYISPPRELSKPDISNGSEKYIVWTHGNSDNLCFMVPYLQQLQDDLNIGFIVFDYQGYGCSKGTPSENKCYDDIETVMNYAINYLNIDKKNLFLVGQSLGTGIVVHYSNKNSWTTPIILISPYKTIVKVIFDSSCVRPIDKFQTENKIENLKCPVKIIHGKEDDLIKIKHGLAD